jgi:nitroimidazol reductase NimA-like FMN-containing flavoprotein (pyridoxamine 5'-phosphate oxidase superfamily)
MLHDQVDQWITGRAELEIRRWLYGIDQWKPEIAGADAPHTHDAPLIGTLNHDEIDQLLRAEIVGRIGCHADTTTYIVPVTYVYAHGCIYGLLGAGMKLKLLRANPMVCFEVDHIADMTNWQSVIAWGRFEELHGIDAEQALHLLVERMAQHMGSAPRSPSKNDVLPGHAGLEGHAPILYRIVLTKRTGRFESR